MGGCRCWLSQSPCISRTGGRSGACTPHSIGCSWPHSFRGLLTYGYSTYSIRDATERLPSRHSSSGLWQRERGQIASNQRVEDGHNWQPGQPAAQLSLDLSDPKGASGGRPRPLRFTVAQRVAREYLFALSKRLPYLSSRHVTTEALSIQVPFLCCTYLISYTLTYIHRSHHREPFLHLCTLT